MSMLVVAAHPDDEVLGAGGTISRLVRQGEEVHVHILGEGGTSRVERIEGDSPSSLEEHARRAAAALGVSSLTCHGLPDNRLDQVEFLEIVQLVEQAVGETGAIRVLTHSTVDLNVDHRIIGQAVITATRPLAKATPVSVLSFETLSSSEWGFGAFGTFQPNLFVEIGENDLERKLSAMREYPSELREAPHPRSIDLLVTLAKLRGSTIGASYAEAFQVIRQVDFLRTSL